MNFFIDVIAEIMIHFPILESSQNDSFGIYFLNINRYKLIFGRIRVQIDISFAKRVNSKLTNNI